LEGKIKKLEAELKLTKLNKEEENVKGKTRGQKKK